MAFSLSPFVEVNEKNASFNINQLPSTNTGMVLTADTGPAFEIMYLDSVTTLEKKFGTPTKYNYKDWFNAWNFLQYASSLQASRPIDALKASKNVAVVLSGGDEATAMTTFQGFAQSTLYGDSVAEMTLPNLVVDSITKVLSSAISDSGGDYSFANLSIIGLNQITQKGIAGVDSQVLQLNAVDTWEISGSTGSYVVTPVGPAPTGWTDNVRLVATESQAFVVGEVMTQTGGGAGVGTVTAINGAADYNIDVTSGYFDDTASAIAGDIAGTGTAVVSCVSNSFSADGSDILTGIVSEVKLALYNKYVTSDQKLSFGVCSQTETWDLQVSSDIANLFSSYFDYTPAWDNNDVLILVFETQDDGTKELVEKHHCSYSETARDAVSNRNIYVENWLLQESDYIYGKVSTGGSIVNTSFGVAPTMFHTEFSSIYPRTADVFSTASYTGIYVTGDVDEAFEAFSDPDSIDVNILLSHELSYAKATSIAADRKDCVGIVVPYDSAALVGKSSSEGVTYLSTKFGTKDSTAPLWADFSTYAAVYGNMKYQYDKYSDVNRWMGIAGDVAGIYAETDNSNDPWWAPAGVNRGKMKNTIKVAFPVNKAGRDVLYMNAINPVISIKGEGQGVVLGQRTATATASAIDRVNVRRLLITIEKAIATSLRPFMFEFNDVGTRNNIRGLVNPYLAQVKSRRGLYDFKVVCDDTNNTDEVIDQNGLVLDVFVKPTKVAEFLQVNVVVTRTGASFDEIAV